MSADEQERRDTLEAYEYLARFNARTEADRLNDELDRDAARDMRTTRLRAGQRYAQTQE